MNKTIKYILIVAAAIFFFIVPAKWLFNDGLSLCLFKYLTSVECPLCGMTRACYNIAHFDFLKALDYNPASLLIPFMVLNEIGIDIFNIQVLKTVRKILIILFLSVLLFLFLYRLGLFQ